MKDSRRILAPTTLLACCLTCAHASELPDLIERAKPSVLLVGTYAPTDSPRFTFRGTGFVVSDGNLAITNVHVLPPTESLGATRELMVQAFDVSGGIWRPRLAKVVGTDPGHDLALLSFEGQAVAPLALARAPVREGAAIALMGFPLAGALGYSMVTHRGVVSSKTSISGPAGDARQLNERALRQLRVGAFEVLQLDAIAYPGNSGGPVFELESGAVIGVISMVMVKGTKESALSAPTGITYAVPTQYVANLLTTFAR